MKKFFLPLSLIFFVYLAKILQIYVNYSIASYYIHEILGRTFELNKMNVSCTNILMIACKLFIMKVDDMLIKNSLQGVDENSLSKSVERFILNIFKQINNKTYDIICLKITNFSLSSYTDENINISLMKSIGISPKSFIGKGSILIKFRIYIFLKNRVFDDLSLERKFFVKIVHPIRFFLMLNMYKDMREVVNNIHLNETILCNCTKDEIKERIIRKIKSKFPHPSDIKINYHVEIKIWKSYYTNCFRLKIIVNQIYFIDKKNLSFKKEEKIKIIFNPILKIIRG
ncbi:MAG: hypothetical protein DRJ34_00350 [Thermoprotei archaeon]|nr:MAG: hypothetical protein DRJ34_00350 [Thermoprotei archaeon]